MQFISGLPSVYTVGCVPSDSLMFLYSLLADSITKKGVPAFCKILLTVVVLPLPVMPQIKVCLARSRLDNANGIWLICRFPSVMNPSSIPCVRSETNGYTFPFFNSKSGTDPNGILHIIPNSSEVKAVHREEEFLFALYYLGRMMELSFASSFVN